MSGKSQAPEAVKVTIERGNAKANTKKIGKAKNGVTNTAILNRMNASNVTNAALRDARIEYLSNLSKRSIIEEEQYINDSK